MKARKKPVIVDVVLFDRKKAESNFAKVVLVSNLRQLFVETEIN